MKLRTINILFILLSTMSAGCFSLRQPADGGAEDSADGDKDATATDALAHDIGDVLADNFTAEITVDAVADGSELDAGPSDARPAGDGGPEMDVPSSPIDGSPFVDANRSDITCLAGQEPGGNSCFPATAARLIYPISLSNVTHLRPTVSWTWPNGAPPLSYVIFCYDRNCSRNGGSVMTNQTSVVAPLALPANTTIFWRVTATNGSGDFSVRSSATWLFHTPRSDRPVPSAPNYGAHLDVNGDGVDDVVIGSRSASSPGRTNNGRVEIFHGNAMGGLSAAPNTVLLGGAAFEYFGSVVANIGDVNGDGYGDIAIGTDNASPMGLMLAGSVSVYFGASAGIAAAPAVVLTGSAANDYFGYAVAGGGDFNGDGYADFAVGAPGVDGAGQMDIGQTRVFLGSASGPTNPRDLLGSAAFDNEGSAVALSGDYDGDGLADLVTTAPNALSGAGRGRVRYGNRAADLITRPLQFANAMTGEHFGSSVAGDADYDGDGYSDVFIGVKDRVISNFARGSVFVFRSGGATGLISNRTFELGNAQAGDQFGFSVCNAGDLNGDGRDDIAVGSPMADPMALNSAGVVSIYYGTAMLPAAPNLVLMGTNTGDQFGFAVAGLGDTNGDGLSDLGVGARFATRAGNANAGVASVYYGSERNFGVAAPVRYVGTAANQELGNSLALLLRPARRVRRWVL
jgi:hypothetical protein